MVTVSAPASIDNAESELSDFTKKSTNATPSWLIVTVPSALLALPVVTVKCAFTVAPNPTSKVLDAP